MINLTLFIVIAFSVANNFRTDVIHEDLGWFSFTGLENLRYFTTLSNMFCAITALITLIFNVKNALKDEFIIPEWVTLLKYAATTALAVTFVTVTVFLSPLIALNGKSYFLLFKGNSFFMHFLSPALAILNFCLFERANRIKFKHAFLAILPMALYSVVYLSCVLWFKVWPDFYNFTLNGNYALLPIVVTGMYLATFGISLLLRLFHNKSVSAINAGKENPQKEKTKNETNENAAIKS